MLSSGAAFLIDGSLYNSLGLVFLVLGVLTSIRFLGYPDLTPDGSFTLSACVFARLLADGYPEILSLIAGLIVGFLCGSTTIILNEKLRIGKLLSSVIVMIVAIALAPYVMGAATIGLSRYPTIVNGLAERDLEASISMGFSDIAVHPISLAVGVLVISITTGLMSAAFHTRHGVAVRYLGSSLNPTPIIRQYAGHYKFIGLVAANLLVAFGGIIEAQRRGSVDQGMGLGVVLMAISSLIMGESIIRKIRRRSTLSVKDEIGAAIIGTIAYSLLIQTVLILGFETVDLRLLTAVALVVALALTHRTEGRKDELF